MIKTVCDIVAKYDGWDAALTGFRVSRAFAKLKALRLRASVFIPT